MQIEWDSPRNYFFWRNFTMSSRSFQFFDGILPFIIQRTRSFYPISSVPIFFLSFFLLLSNTVAVQDISFPLLADDVIYAIWWERKEELGGVNCCVEADPRRTVLS